MADEEPKVGFEQWGVHLVNPAGEESIWVPRERITLEEILREFIPGLVQTHQDVYVVRRYSTPWERVDV